MSGFSCIRSLIFCGFLSVSLGAQTLHLLETPYTLMSASRPIRITWKQDVTATLHYGKSPQSLNSKLNVSGRKTLEFIPNAVNMQPGRYFGRISNGAQSSSVFMFAIETSLTPAMKAPQNNSVVREPGVRFVWDAVSNVPCYHVMVTDHEARIKQDANGDMQLEGANVVWQAITPDLTIAYGAPDPSGYFDDFNSLAPPLMQGRRYQWAVLNNYGNHPAWSSTAQSGLSGFTVQYADMLAAPNLIGPDANAILQSRTVDFTWNAVGNARHYELYLFEEMVQDQSRSTFPVFRGVTETHQITLKAHEILKAGHHAWTVLALDDQGRAIGSEFRAFQYAGAANTLNITTKSVYGAWLPRTMIRLRALDGSNEITALPTRESAILTLNLQAGLYEIHASKSGFADTTQTVRLEAGEAANTTISLRPEFHQLSGEVRDKDGKAVTHAVAYAYQAENNRTVRADVVGGFVIDLSPGNWQVWAEQMSLTTEKVAVAMTGSQTLSVPLKFQSRAFHITGQAQTSAGKALAGATVTADGSGRSVQAVTDRSGRFGMTLAEGTWSIRMLHAGFAPSAVRQVTVSQNEALSAPFVMDTEGMHVNGFVYGGDTGIKNASIQICAPSGPPVLLRTNARGGFSVTLGKAPYRLYVTAHGYANPAPLLLDFRTFNPADPILIRLDAADAAVWGRVMTTGGQALADAIITTSSGSDTSGPDGFYRMALPAGRHTISVNKPGYTLTGPISVTLTGGQKKRLDLALSGNAGTVQGVIRSASGGIAFATLAAIRNQDTTRVRADVYGRFSLALAPGVYQMTASAAGYLGAVRPTLAVTAAQTLKGIDFQLAENNGVIRGTIRGLSNQKLADVRVRAQSDPLETRTDHDGHYALILDAGRHRLTFSQPGYASQVVQIMAAAHHSLTQNVQLTAEGRVTGRIMQVNGVPIWDAEIAGFFHGDSVITRSDHAGYYELIVPPGQVRVVFDQLGYDKHTQTWTFGSGTMREHNVKLISNPSEISSIKGKVTHSSGASLGGVLMQLQGKGAGSASTESNGTYVIERLEAGNTMKLTPVKAGHFFIPSQRDYMPLTGHRTGQNFRAGLYGDVSGNDKVSSFDGALVLRVSAGQHPAPNYQDLPRDSIAADVSGNGGISAFDASLIFRYSVGLIQRFPVEENAVGKAAASAPDVIWVTQETEDPDTLRLTIHFDVASVFHAMDIGLRYPRFEFTPCPDAIRFTHPLESAFHFRDGRGKLSLAAVHPVDAASFRCEIPFVRLKNTSEHVPMIQSLHVDEQHVEIRNASSSHLELMGVAPNPFNSEIMIHLFVPENRLGDNPLTIHIYNVIGRKVDEIHYPLTRAGLHQIPWRGRNRRGQEVASGVYLMQIDAGTPIRMKILCVR